MILLVHITLRVFVSVRKHHLEAVKVISAKVYWHLWSHIHFPIWVTWQGSVCGHHGAPANTTHPTNVGPMLAHRLRRLPTIDPTLILCCFPIKSVLIGRCATANMPNIGLKLVGCVVFARCSPGYFQYSLVAADYKEKYHVFKLVLLLQFFCAWARHFTSMCFTSLRCKWIPGRTEMTMCTISS